MENWNWGRAFSPDSCLLKNAVPIWTVSLVVQINHFKPIDIHWKYVSMLRKPAKLKHLTRSMVFIARIILLKLVLKDEKMFFMNQLFRVDSMCTFWNPWPVYFGTGVFHQGWKSFHGKVIECEVQWFLGSRKVDCTNVYYLDPRAAVTT